METAAKDALQLQNKAHVASGVNTVCRVRPPRKQGPKPKRNYYLCNKGGHDPEDCYFKKDPISNFPWYIPARKAYWKVAPSSE